MKKCCEKNLKEFNRIVKNYFDNILGLPCPNFFFNFNRERKDKIKD